MKWLLFSILNFEVCPGNYFVCSLLSSISLCECTTFYYSTLLLMNIRVISNTATVNMFVHVSCYKCAWAHLGSNLWLELYQRVHAFCYVVDYIPLVIYYVKGHISFFQIWIFKCFNTTYWRICPFPKLRSYVDVYGFVSMFLGGLGWGLSGE